MPQEQEPTIIRGIEIKTIEIPPKAIIKGFTGAHFTGLTFHQGRQQPFAAWGDGYVIRFTQTREEAIAALRKDIERQQF